VKTISLFSGCGGMDIGAERAGAQVVWANDNMPEAAMTYRTLEERTVDLVIAPVFASMAVEHLRTEILYDEPLVVVAGAQSVWAKRRKLELVELTDAAWALPPLDSLYGSVVTEASSCRRTFSSTRLLRSTRSTTTGGPEFPPVTGSGHPIGRQVDEVPGFR